MIIINRGAVAREDIKREVSPLTARKELYKEWKWREHVLSGALVPTNDGTGTYRPLDRVQDKPEMRKQMLDYKKNYERVAPVALTSQTRNFLWKKAKYLKDQIVIGMVSKRDLHPVSQRVVSKNGVPSTVVVADYDKIRSTKAIERNQAHMKRNQPKINELKNILRTLEPDNPKIGNIERFRPQS